MTLSIQSGYTMFMREGRCVVVVQRCQGGWGKGGAGLSVHLGGTARNTENIILFCFVRETKEGGYCHKTKTDMACGLQ